MRSTSGSSIFVRALACWNWKCALLSAGARSLVYLAAMVHSGSHNSLSIVAVEVIYVTITAGLYAGLQQKALGYHSRVLGDFMIVIAIPALAQALDCLAHRIAGGSAPARATLAVCVFTGVSALFHLYVMRRGTFLSGSCGQTLSDDFRQMPRLVLGFLAQPLTIFSGAYLRISEQAETEISL